MFDVVQINKLVNKSKLNLSVQNDQALAVYFEPPTQKWWQYMLKYFSFGVKLEMHKSVACTYDPHLYADKTSMM